jgi:hypothetical protein
MKGKLKKSSESIFKHTHVFTGHAGGVPYLYAKRGTVDAINRHHVNLYGECDICGEEIILAHINVEADTDKMWFIK